MCIEIFYRTVFAIGVGMLTTSVHADSDPVFSAEPIEACLEADMGYECVNISACHAGSGPSYRACLWQEFEWWDAKVDVLLDAEIASIPTRELEATDPSEAESLRSLNTAWKTWREARCLGERIDWGDGTGKFEAQLICLIQTTAGRIVDVDQQSNNAPSILTAWP